MLSARYLANLSDDMVELYAQMEYEIKRDIFKRLEKLQKVTDSTIHQVEILKQTSELKTDVEKIVSKYNKLAQKQLISLYEEAIEKAGNSDKRYFELAKRELSDNQSQIASATIDRFDMDRENVINKTFARNSKYFEQISDSITRMTLTVAENSQKAFLRECNRAYFKVISGAYDWKSAYKSAVISLSREAIKCGYTYRADIEGDTPTILYNYSGKTREYSIESAVRMNILTGINQTASQQTLENCDTTGTDLVEVSAHIGARDIDRAGKPWANHSSWQGKVFCLSGERDYRDADGIIRHAPNFYESCGLGEPDGVCGINCRHSFYPYYEGMPLEYSKGELDEMNDKQVPYNNKMITPYEAEQNLRICERAIRSYKSEVYGLELTHNENAPEYIKAKNKLWSWQENARDICSQTGIQRKYINEYIGTASGVQPRGAKPKE